ncbi:hypothetical protein MAPG_09430, partial [Magnaporthiopsis poae ATCC 64411]
MCALHPSFSSTKLSPPRFNTTDRRNRRLQTQLALWREVGQGSLGWPGQQHQKMIEAPLRLRRAIHAGDALLVRRILKSHPHLLHNPDLLLPNSPGTATGNSNLHLAAHLGHADIVSLLISLGHEDPDPAVNERHQTALMLAAAAGHTEVVHLLCEADAAVIL